MTLRARINIAPILSNPAVVAKLVIVPIYPKSVANIIREPAFSRSIADPNACGSDAKFDCGCFVRIEIRISSEPVRVEEIGFRTNGCGYMTAASERICSSLQGKFLAEMHGEIGAALPRSPRADCSFAVVQAARSAFADHRERRVEEFGGEGALICTCFGITEGAIADHVSSRRSTNVQAVSDDLRAGSGCGACRILIQEIIDAND